MAFELATVLLRRERPLIGLVDGYGGLSFTALEKLCAIVCVCSVCLLAAVKKSTEGNTKARATRRRRVRGRAGRNAPACVRRRRAVLWQAYFGKDGPSCLDIQPRSARGRPIERGRRAPRRARCARWRPAALLRAGLRYRILLHVDRYSCTHMYSSACDAYSCTAQQQLASSKSSRDRMCGSCTAVILVR